MTDTGQTWNIVGGSDVIGSDGEKLGTVDRVEGNYIVAKKGWFFPTDYYIPSDAIASVTDDVVSLNVPKDTVLNQGWDAAPDSYADTTGTYAAGAGTGTFAGDNAAITGTTAGMRDIGEETPVVGDYDETDRPFDHHASGDTTHLDDSDTIRVPLAEEELTATRREVERGEIRVDKDVVAEEQTLDVPVTEERVMVNRRVVDRDVAPGDTTFEEGTIEVPVRGEEVDVQKQAHVREELEISKERVDRTERVSDTVRREEAHVTDTTETVDGDDLLDRDANRR